MEADPWKEFTLLALEGGGTRGFASLLMLRALMREIARIEMFLHAPEGVNIPNWQPHVSSFYPNDLSTTEEPEIPSLSQAPSAHRKASSLKPGAPKRQRTERTPSPERRRRETREELRSTSSKYLPCHYFDYIGGTSTGGLAAVMLGRLRMSVDECINRYPNMAKKIFGHPTKFAAKGYLRDKYDAQVLQDQIQAIVDERLRSGETDEKFQRFPSPDDLCKTALISKRDDDDAFPYIIRTYDNDNRPGGNPDNPGPAQDWPIWQACRATSAAPRYFKHIEIEGHTYSDGGMGFNDPTLELFEDVCVHENWQKGNPTVVSAVLTLGTGAKPTPTDRARGFIGRRMHRVSNFLERIEGTILSPAKTEREMRKKANEGRFIYHKWNGGTKVGGLSMDNCKAKTFKDMEAWVNEHMDQPHIQNEVADIAKHLVRKRRLRQMANQDRWERFALCTMYGCPKKNCGVLSPTRPELLAHVQSAHPGVFQDPETEVMEEKAITPWLRGPW